METERTNLERHLKSSAISSAMENSGVPISTVKVNPGLLAPDKETKVRKSNLEGKRTMSSVFQVYDTDGDGYIHREELVRAMLNHAEHFNLTLTRSKAETLASSVFEAASVDSHEKLSKEDLGDLVQNVLSESITLKRRESHLAQNVSKISWRLRKAVGHFSHYKHEFVCLLLYVALCILLFLIGALTALEDNTYKNVSPTAWYILARGFGMVLDINCGLIVVPVLRFAVTFVRKTKIAHYIPLDALPKFHILCAICIIIASIGHIVAHIMNFEYMSDESDRHATLAEYLFVPIDGTPGLIPGSACITGWMLVVALMILIIFSLPVIRQSHHFQLFYWFHKLYVVIWVLLIFHSWRFWMFFCVFGGLFLVERIKKYYDTLRRKGVTEICEAYLLPSQVVHLVIRRPADFKYNPGDYIYLKVSSITAFEWHAFTISSPPEMQDYIWVHIRAVGNWTRALYVYLSRHSAKRRSLLTKRSAKRLQSQLSSEATEQVFRSLSSQEQTGSKDSRPAKIIPVIKIPVQIDGPYGSSTTAIFHTEHAVLIGTGIGVTPFASVLGSVLQSVRNSSVCCPHCDNAFTNPAAGLAINQRKLTLKKVDFIWVCREQKNIQWFLDLLQQWEEELQSIRSIKSEYDFVTAQIYVTSGPRKSNLSVVGLSLGLALHFKQNQRDLFTGLRAQTRGGRPNWTEIFSAINQNKKGQVRIFFCGNNTLARTIRSHCADYKFDFSWETF